MIIQIYISNEQITGWRSKKYNYNPIVISLCLVIVDGYVIFLFGKILIFQKFIYIYEFVTKRSFIWFHLSFVIKSVFFYSVKLNFSKFFNFEFYLTQKSFVLYDKGYSI